MAESLSDESEAENLFSVHVYTREQVTEDWILEKDIKITIPEASWFENKMKLNQGVLFRCYFTNNSSNYVDYIGADSEIIKDLLSLYKKLLLLNFGDTQNNQIKYLNGIKPYIE